MRTPFIRFVQCLGLSSSPGQHTSQNAGAEDLFLYPHHEPVYRAGTRMWSANLARHISTLSIVARARPLGFLQLHCRWPITTCTLRPPSCMASYLCPRFLQAVRTVHSTVYTIWPEVSGHCMMAAARSATDTPSLTENHAKITGQIPDKVLVQ